MIKSLLSICLFICLGLVSCSKTDRLAPIQTTPNLANKNNVTAKLNSGLNIKIACEGTSLTYGEDIGGTDTISSSLVNGPTRAKYQYPASMRQALNNPQITLSLRGYPGDRTTEALDRWKDSTTADICIIEYGTNDAYNFAGYASGTVSVAVYKTQLSELVERRVNQGAWVILCLSPHLQNNNTDIDAYRTAAAEVAKEFYVDTYDVDQALKGLSYNPYSDLVHFNSEGYQSWGIQIAKLVAVVN